MVTWLITQRLGEMVEDVGTCSTMIHSKRKALTALFPYVVLRVKEGKREMFDAFLRVVRSSRRSGLMWFYIEPLLSALLDEKAPTPPEVGRDIGITSRTLVAVRRWWTVNPAVGGRVFSIQVHGCIFSNRVRGRRWSECRRYAVAGCVLEIASDISWYVVVVEHAS